MLELPKQYVYPCFECNKFFRGATPSEVVNQLLNHRSAKHLNDMRQELIKKIEKFNQQKSPADTASIKLL